MNYEITGPYTDLNYDRETSRNYNGNNYLALALSALSKWIANFGVVPWLRLRAFLFCPAFFCLAAFLIFVIRVFETITVLLFQHLSYFFSNRPLVLSRNDNCVKIMLFLLLFTSPVVSSSIKTVYLKKGQFFSIPAQNIENFSAGDKRVIKTKLLSQQATLIIKAIKKGASDLLLFYPDGQKIIRFIVNNSPKKVVAKKIITTLKQYRNVKTSYPNPPSSLSLSTSLKKKILAKTYLILFQQGLNDFFCQVDGIKLICFYENSQTIHGPTKKHLKELFYIIFIPTEGNKNRLYELSFKLILIEKNSSHTIQIGIQKLVGDLNTLFTQGLAQLLKNHHQQLSSESLSIQSLAHEKMVMRYGTTNEISFGSKTQYEDVIIKDGKTFVMKKWLFTGLKAKFKIFRENGTHYLNFNTSFSRPIGPENLTTNRQKGTVPLQTGQAIKFFEISYLAKQDKNQQLPLIGTLPILKAIFSSRQGQEVQKKISAFISVKEITL